MGKLLKIRDDNKSIYYSVFMLLMGLLMVLPFIFMISASFKPQAMITAEPLKLIPDMLYLENYKLVITSMYFFKWYWNSIWIVSVTVILRVLFVTTAAYAFARLKIPGKNMLFVAVFSVMMVPSDTTLISRYLIFKKLHLYGTPWAIVLSFTFDVFMLFLIRQFFMQIPNELTEAAVVDGCSHFKIYYKIMIPLCKPGLITMILFTFIWVWNNFMESYVFIDKLANQTITVGLQYFQSSAGINMGMIMAGATLATLPTIILFAGAQKYFIQGIVGVGIKG